METLNKELNKDYNSTNPKLSHQINHIVLSGGGPTLLYTLGILRQLSVLNVINRENIKSIYGTSAGAIAGLLISLNVDWEVLFDYIIRRPWHEVFDIKIQNILDVYTRKGLFDKSVFVKCFKPVFGALNIPLTINLYELYELTKIEFHVIAFELNGFKTTNISYLTHPKLEVLDAIHMSCALPLLIEPVFNSAGKECYMDGGVENNYPLNFCLKDGNDKERILGIKNVYIRDDEMPPVRGDNITPESNVFDLMMTFIGRALGKMNKDAEQEQIPYEIKCDTKYISLDYLKETFSDAEIRRSLLQKGEQIATDWMNAQETHEPMK